MSTERCRFAPTTSGPAHPGTLLAALLCWLDARARDAPLRLRLEDVDPQRCSPESAADMRDALRWLGLDWDAESLQSQHRGRHEAALARLAELGRLYACGCSRSALRAAGERAADGGFRYPGRCRERVLRGGEARPADTALRLRLPEGRIPLSDESGLDLSQDACAAMGDPVLQRRDGAVAYHLAAVVDDAAEGVTRVVRGRDLAVCTATQVALQRALGLPTPVYRHHLLLLEESGGKLAKLHGAVGWHALRDAGPAPRWCGLLAWLAGLRERPDPTTPQELRADFSWDRVRERDVVLRWTGETLQVVEPPPADLAAADLSGAGSP